MNKVFNSAKEAVRDIFDGATIMVGGFHMGPAMSPGALIEAVCEKGVKNITLIIQTVANTVEHTKKVFSPNGLSMVDIWFERRQVRKVITTWHRGFLAAISCWGS
jgi:acyl CoA:acetate/3-ketoacid CoA transferase alpha subunit